MYEFVIMSLDEETLCDRFTKFSIYLSIFLAIYIGLSSFTTYLYAGQYAGVVGGGSEESHLEDIYNA